MYFFIQVIISLFRRRILPEIIFYGDYPPQTEVFCRPAVNAPYSGSGTVRPVPTADRRNRPPPDALTDRRNRCRPIPIIYTLATADLSGKRSAQGRPENAARINMQNG